MAKKHSTAAAAWLEPSEDTADRIQAFLASMVPLNGIVPGSEYFAGRSAIERIALSCKGNGSRFPEIRLSARECADILGFLGRSTPAKPEIWWNDPTDAPNHICGRQAVLYALERHAMAEEALQEGTSASERRTSPVALVDRIPLVTDEQDDGKLDSDTVARRLREVKETIWRACGVVVCVMTKLGAEGEITDEMNALEMAHEQLKQLADEDIDVLVLGPESGVQS